LGMISLIIIQARSNSKRFPNKIFCRVKGKRLIDYSIDNALKLKMPLFVAIPKGDNRLIQYCKSRLISYFEGSELERA